MSSVGAVRAGRAYIEIFADSSRLMSGLRDAESNVKRFAGSLTGIGSSLATVGMAAAVPTGLAVKTFADFDDQMRAVQAVSGSTGDAFVALTEKAKELGRTTSFTAAQVAEGMLNLGRAGFKSNEIDASIASVMNLSRATQTEIPLATDIAGNALRAFGLESNEMGRVCDVLTATANGSAQTLEDLGEAFKFVAPIAKDAGASIEDAAKIVGTLANFGLKGSLAGTAYKNIQLKMADPAVQKSYEELGVSVTDAQGNLRGMADVLRELGAATANMPNAKKLGIFKDLFSMYGLSGGIKLTSANFDALYDSIDNAAGIAQKTADDMDRGLGGKFRLTESAIEGVAIKMGETLAPTISEVCDQIMTVSESLVGWIGRNEETVTAVAKLAAGVLAAGGGFLAVGYSINAVASSMTAMRGALTGTIAILDKMSGSTAKLQALETAEIELKQAQIAVDAKRQALEKANLAEINASVAAYRAEIDAAQEEAILRGKIAKQRAFDVAATAASTKARLLDAQATRAQAAVEAAQAAGADAATVARLKANAQERASAAATAQAAAQAAAKKAAAAQAEVAALNSQRTARAKAAAEALAQAAATAESARQEHKDAQATLTNAQAKRTAAAATASLTKRVGALLRTMAPFLIITGVAAALNHFASSASRAAEAAHDATEALREQQRVEEEAVNAKQKLFDRLVELSKKQSLANNEFGEGCKIVRQLRNFYGDLGIEINETAKSFENVAEAADDFHERQKALEQQRRKTRLVALQNELNLREKEDAAIMGGAYKGFDLKDLDYQYYDFWGDIKYKAGEIYQGWKGNLTESAILGRQNEMQRLRGEVNALQQEIELHEPNSESKVESADDENPKEFENFAGYSPTDSATGATTVVIPGKPTEKEKIAPVDLESARTAIDNQKTRLDRVGLGEFDLRRAEALDTFNEFYSSRDKYLAAVQKEKPSEYASEVRRLAAYEQKARDAYDSEVDKIGREEQKYNADAAEKKRAEEQKAAETKTEKEKADAERKRNQPLVDAQRKETEARLAYARSLSSGIGVYQAKANLTKATDERENAERSVADETARAALSEYSAALKALDDAEKKGDQHEIDAAKRRVDDAATDLESANSDLSRVIEGAINAQNALAKTSLASNGTFNALEALDMGESNKELEELKAHTKLLSKIERKFKFEGDDSLI